MAKTQKTQEPQKRVKTDADSIRRVAAGGMHEILRLLKGATAEQPPSEHVLTTFVELAKYLEMERTAKAVKEFSVRFEEMEKRINSMSSSKQMEKAGPKRFPRPARTRRG